LEVEQMSNLVAVHNHTGEILLCTRYESETNKGAPPGYELLVHPGTKQNLQWTEEHPGDPTGNWVLTHGSEETWESVVDDAHRLEIPAAYGWDQLREGHRRIDIYRAADSGPRPNPRFSGYGLVEHVSSIYLQTGDGSNRVENIKGKRDLDFYIGDRSKDWDATQSKNNRLDPKRDQLQLRGTPRRNDSPVDLTLHISKCKPGAKSKTFPGYELTGFVKREPSTEKKIAEHFKALGPGFVKGLLVGVNTDKKGAAQRMKTAMNHPSTQSLRDTAASAGYKSIGFVSGFDAALGVGAGAMIGMLMGLGSSADTKSYLLTSEDLTIGVEEGVTVFEGLFLSTEPPSDIADHYEFFVEADVDVVAGVGIRYFWSMGGSNGLLTTITTGEELGASWGVGVSQATLI
jgi:hypothetical protein